ncbi:WXG100 family type VII secretion target [Kitasatospora sp. NPDC090091]|uniref:WXG100 family type VII secretion target n=1 Tax=Kitasatospora sp. NPDC090091 TaxID=3364081 RepID=UPI00382B22B3
MVDMDFERRMNPWLFDSSGNLTEAAKKQFPDLAAAASGAPAPGWVPVASGTPGPSGVTVKVSPDALRRAATNTGTLQTKFSQACGKPFDRLHEMTQDMPQGWAVVGALSTARDVWDAQVKSLGELLGRVGENLTATADSYARAEQLNAQNFGKS